jgi:hypothetical protein
VALALAVCLPIAACATTSVSSPPPSSRATTTSSHTVVTAAPEAQNPGDIPDTVAYVPYTSTAGGYSLVHPEGWAQTATRSSVSFVNVYNEVAASLKHSPASPTVASAHAVDVPLLRASEPSFLLKSVSRVTLPAGSGVVITYLRNSPPDPVTGRSVRQVVQRYEVYRNHKVVVLELSGAVGADNVDAYRRVSRSLRIS